MRRYAPLSCHKPDEEALHWKNADFYGKTSSKETLLLLPRPSALKGIVQIQDTLPRSPKKTIAEKMLPPRAGCSPKNKK